MTAGVSAHPFLFFLIGVLATVQIGLVAYRVHLHNNSRFPWPSDEYKNRIYFEVFVACWTFLGAILHWIVNIFFGLIWTTITLVFWAVAADLYQNVVQFTAKDCSGSSINSTCRQEVAISAVGWTELALTTVLFLAILFHVHSRRRAGYSYRNAGYDGFYA